MKVAVVAPIGAGITADPVWMSEFARHLEACGFESIVMAEHTVLVTRYTSVYPYDPSGRVDVAPGCPVPDPLEMLAFLAGRTTTLGLATGVLVLPNHHPVMLAKRAATIDVISGGRLRLCVGVGWLREEIEACGAGFDSRGRRADEQIAVLRALWADHPDGVGDTGNGERCPGNVEARPGFVAGIAVGGFDLRFVFGHEGGKFAAVELIHADIRTQFHIGQQFGPDPHLIRLCAVPLGDVLLVGRIICQPAGRYPQRGTEIFQVALKIFIIRLSTQEIGEQQNGKKEQ